ncbi:uncharacterized protein LOC135496612 [Lineus longissimus]|uniref:uncharacterized protein LOC135496612 n=1 Tax=Lineus longissimus TaxID=88925 RepID=UPI00315D8617
MLGNGKRLLLAALHFNENSGRGQRIARNGIPYFNRVTPRGREGHSIVIPVKKTPTFGYVQIFFTEVQKLVTSGQSYVILEDPPTVCSKFDRPSKEELIKDRKSFERF